MAKEGRAPVTTPLAQLAKGTRFESDIEKQETLKRLKKEAGVPLREDRHGPVPDRPKRENFVDNAEFLRELIEYRADSAVEQAVTGKRARIPACIGSKVALICEHLIHRREFMPYHFKEEMVSDAKENCILRLHNFDPAKSSNPFAYFTQIAYYAFVRRIQKEQREFNTKVEYARNVGLDDMVDQARQAAKDSWTGTDENHYTELAHHLSSYMSQNLLDVKAAGAEKDKSKSTLQPTLTYRRKKAAEEKARLDAEGADPIDQQIDKVLGEGGEE